MNRGVNREPRKIHEQGRPKSFSPFAYSVYFAVKNSGAARRDGFELKFVVGHGFVDGNGFNRVETN